MSKLPRCLPEREGESLEEGRRLWAESARLIATVKGQCAHIAWLIDSIKRQRDPEYFRPLQAAIRAMHGCESRHRTSFAVRKVSAGTVLWEGIVDEFRLVGHPHASHCYGWTYAEAGQVRYFSLLKLPPVDSPQAAVQMALAARELAEKAADPMHGIAVTNPPPAEDHPLGGRPTRQRTNQGKAPANES